MLLQVSAINRLLSSGLFDLYKVLVQDKRTVILALKKKKLEGFLSQGIKITHIPGGD